VLGHAPISPGLSPPESAPSVMESPCHSSENARIDRAAAWAAHRSVHPFSRGHFVFQRRCGTAPVCPEFRFHLPPCAASGPPVAVRAQQLAPALARDALRPERSQSAHAARRHPRSHDLRPDQVPGTGGWVVARAGGQERLRQPPLHGGGSRQREKRIRD